MKQIANAIESLFNSGFQDINVAIKDIEHYYRYGDITHSEAMSLKKQFIKDLHKLVNDIQKL